MIKKTKITTTCKKESDLPSLENKTLGLGSEGIEDKDKLENLIEETVEDEIRHRKTPQPIEESKKY